MIKLAAMNNDEFAHIKKIEYELHDQTSHVKLIMDHYR